MSSTRYDHLSVGEIAASNPTAAAVLDRFNVDFCCHGKTAFAVACALAGHEPEKVAAALEEAGEGAIAGTPDFQRWPTDLLCDYVLKTHHRQIPVDGPAILRLLDKVKAAHGERHPELYEVAELFSQSFAALSEHLMKEENILFPYIYRLCEADLSGGTAPRFHCADGRVASPIRVMEHEHEGEGERHARIEALTHGYTTPEDACGSYRLLMTQLKAFKDALHEHIHIENNLIFPRAIELERKTVH